MRSYFLSLALLFIAFTEPSIAQKAAGAELVVAEGAPLTVECALRVEQRAEWSVDGAAPAADLRAAGERAGAGVTARLHAERARAAHAGLYSCGGGAAPVRVRVLPAAAAAAPASESPASPAPPAPPAAAEDEVAGKLVLFQLFSPLSFNCTLRDQDAGVSQFQWYKNGSLVEGVGSPRGPVLEEGGSKLTFKRAHEEDFGNYTCRVGGGVAGAWQAHAMPIARVPANTNVVEGQKFSITCKLIGKPYPRVAWTYKADESEKNETEVDMSEGSRFSAKDSAAGVPGGVLEVADARRADAGVYACVPPHGQRAASTLRVKDVYAALWPFLGICLEVFILCAIILVYEKRRTKPELDDSDADTHDQ